MSDDLLLDQPFLTYATSSPTALRQRNAQAANAAGRAFLETCTLVGGPSHLDLAVGVSPRCDALVAALLGGPIPGDPVVAGLLAALPASGWSSGRGITIEGPDGTEDPAPAQAEWRALGDETIPHAVLAALVDALAEGGPVHFVARYAFRFKGPDGAPLPDPPGGHPTSSLQQYFDQRFEVGPYGFWPSFVFPFARVDDVFRAWWAWLADRCPVRLNPAHLRLRSPTRSGGTRFTKVSL